MRRRGSENNKKKSTLRVDEPQIWWLFGGSNARGARAELAAPL